MSEERQDVLIVGASAAGLRCACRLARLRPLWNITVVEARDTFSYAACGLPYLLSGEIGEADSLRSTEYGSLRDVEYFAAFKRVQVLTRHRAVAVDTARRSLSVAGPEGTRELHWDELVLANGSRPRRLERMPQDPRVLTFHVWDDLAPLRSKLAAGELERVALVGAGLVGCELAEAFGDLWGCEVVLLEAADTPLPGILDTTMGARVARHLHDSGVKLMLNSPVERITAEAAGVKLSTPQGTVEAQAAVLAIGVEPVVELARQAGVALGPTGAIAVGENLATSVGHIWAVGDCAEVRHAVSGEPAHIPQGSLANRQGRTLANILAGIPDLFPPVAGAMAVKIFDWNIAAVGSTAGQAQRSGIHARSAWVSTTDRAHYWPRSEEIHLQLVYDPASRRVLGVQAAGAGETVKRIDVATQLITRQATLEDFARLEHAYAPPYSPPIDPLAVAAFVAQNQEEGIVAAPPGAPTGELSILDVRQPEEVANRPARAARVANIPLGELAGRIDQIDETLDLVVCSRGTRSAEAVRLLRHHGVRVPYLGGGIRWLTD